MEDVSLEELMAQLAQAQEAKSTVRLSERNVVELVSKLQSLGLLGADLLHTVDGRAYITKEQLTADVAAAVDAAGGRVGVADLPALLNADLVHCEAAAAAAVAASKGSTSLVGGDIISARYFDGVVAELAADLAARSGALPLSIACSRFQLAADTLTRVLEPALRDGRIDATLDGGVLTTAAAARRAKAALRGALRAATAPVPLAPLAKALALEGKAGTPAGLAALVEELIADGAISGALRAGGASFAPTLASAAAAAATAAFYATNGYVEYAALARAAGGASALADAKRKAKDTFPDGTPLPTVIAAPALLAAADAAAEEGAASGWADVGAALPPALTRDDAAALVAASPCAARLIKAGAGPGGGAIMAGTCVVTTAFVDGLAVRAVEVARREAEAALAAKPASKPDTAADKPKAKPAAVAGSDDDDDDWGTGKKGGGGKKKKKGSGGGGKPKPAAKPAAAAPARATGATCAALSLDALEAAIGDDWAPGTADAGCGDDGTSLATALAAAVRPAAVAEYDRVLAEAASAGADARRRARDALVAAAVAAADRLQLYHRGAEAVVPSADDADAAATADAIARHLVRGPGADAGDALLRVMAADADEGGPPPPAPAAAGMAPAARTALVAKLPADVRADAEKLVAALGGTDVPALIDALEAAAPAAGARVRRLDKKSEKALVADARRALEASLAAEADAAAALPLAACAALARVAGRAASVPGRALGALVASLERNGVPAGDAALFSSYHADVVALLKARSAGDEAAAAAAAAKLADALPRLKAAAVGGGGE